MKRILVIGANGTLGSSITAYLKTLHYDVETLSQDKTDYSERSLQAHYESLKQSGAFEMIFCCIGTLHNDMVSPEKRLGQLNENSLTEYFRINTIIPSLCLRFFHKLLTKETSSKFVFLSAMVGSISDNKLGGWYGYRSSKAALNMMIKTASIEVKRTNKNTCLVVMHPGTTQGPLTKPFAGGISKDKYYTPEQSARRIVDLSCQLTPEQTGQFFNWDGSILPW